MTGPRRQPPVDPQQIRRRRLPAEQRDRRTAALTVVVLLLALVLGGRLVQLQAVDADALADRGAAQRSRTVDLPARRGRLYDRAGAVLATSQDSATIYGDPGVLLPETLPDGRVRPPAATPAEVATRLAPLLGADVAELTAQLSRDTRFVYLGRQIDWELGQRIMDLRLPGVFRIAEPQRVYPNGGLAAQLLGFTGLDGVGLHGLESAHDELLSGVPGTLGVESAPQGLTIAAGGQQLSPPSAGTDLVLTIDREIQQRAEQAAAEAVAEFDAIGASVLVLEVGTGQVLAAASTPGFDPHDHGDDPSAWRNRGITDMFEPGSVQKALTIAAALEEGLVSPGTMLTVADSVTIGPKTFRDAHHHPTEPMSVVQIMETSSNVGTMLIADQLGDQRLHDYLVDFGYGQPLGVGVPGEASGLLAPADDWWVTSRPTIAIGQGVAVTLVQAAHAYATLANGGVAVQPTFIRGSVGEDGRLDPTPTPEGVRVVSETTADQVLGMLGTVVAGDDGTGARAAIPGYEVGGKTGTARKPGAGGYTDQYIATFVGVAPLDDPQFVVAVMVDEPFPIFGGVVAAPVFQDVMSFALRSSGVPPTSQANDLDTLFDNAATAREAAAVTGDEGADGGQETAAAATP